MTNHPNRSRTRLSKYGAKLRTVAGSIVVEIVAPNDGARRRFQYRRIGETVERRVLQSNGSPMLDGSPWEAVDLEALRAVRGRYHPILDPLGL